MSTSMNMSTKTNAGITLYGIPNCDTVKKARTWLTAQGIAFTFHDIKKQPLERATVAAWLQCVPHGVLVNRKGTTWRALLDERKAAIVDDDSALDLMLELPAIIKRPVLHIKQPLEQQFHIGFSDAQYRQIFTIQDEPSP
jgi:Spx/MgsR family transcriptional regulator